MDHDAVAPPTQPGPLADSLGADASHLRVLSIIYYVCSGLTVLGVLFGGFYLAMGIAFAVAPPPSPGTNAPPEFLRWMFIVIGIVIILVAVISGVLFLVQGRFLARRVNRPYCLTIAALTCLSIPLGTILGVFTLLVLTRPAVARAFGSGERMIGSSGMSDADDDAGT